MKSKYANVPVVDEKAKIAIYSLAHLHYKKRQFNSLVEACR